MEDNNVQTVTQNVQTVTQNVQEPLPKNMKLCKTCGAMIAKKAKKCPQCGAKNKKPVYKRIWFWILVIIIGAFVIKEIKRSGLDPKNPEFKLTADDLIRACYEGEKDGDKKYKDKAVAVTGIVGSVESDYIRVDCFSQDFTLYTVRVKPADKGDLTKVTKGSVVTASGICNGTVLGGVELEKAILDNSLAVNPDYNSALAVPILDLMKAYNENELAADEKYWGKTLEIKGEVKYIADSADYIVLVPEGHANTLENVLDGITVYFENSSDFDKIKADANPDALGSPKKKTTVTVVGVCYGETFGYDAHLCRAKIK